MCKNIVFINIDNNFSWEGKFLKTFSINDGYHIRYMNIDILFSQAGEKIYAVPLNNNYNFKIWAKNNRLGWSISSVDNHDMNMYNLINEFKDAINKFFEEEHIEEYEMCVDENEVKDDDEDEDI